MSRWAGQTGSGLLSIYHVLFPSAKAVFHKDRRHTPRLQLAHLGAKSKNELFTSSETSKRASWTCSFKTQPLLRRHNTLE